MQDGLEHRFVPSAARGKRASTTAVDWLIHRHTVDRGLHNAIPPPCRGASPALCNGTARLSVQMESAEAIAVVACSDVVCCREAAALWVIVLPPYCLRGRVVILALPKNAASIEDNIVLIQLVSGFFLKRLPRRASRRPILSSLRLVFPLHTATQVTNSAGRERRRLHRCSDKWQMTVRDYSAPWRSVSRITLRRLVQRTVLPARPIDQLLSSLIVSESLRDPVESQRHPLRARPQDPAAFVDDFGVALNSHRTHFGR